MFTFVASFSYLASCNLILANFKSPLSFLKKSGSLKLIPALKLSTLKEFSCLGVSVKKLY